MQPCNYPAADH